METDRDLKAPILQIGVDTRLRNFEQARETLQAGWDDIDHGVVMNGNIAAHCANGAVDAALFKAGLVPDDYLANATEAFKELYMLAPSEYDNESPKSKKVIDCQATIITLKALDRRTNSSGLRDKFYEVEGKPLELKNTKTAREFDSHLDVDVLLGQLERLTKVIVQLERSKGGQRRLQAQQVRLSVWHFQRSQS